MRTSSDPNNNNNNNTEIMNVCSTTSTTNSDTISNLKETDLLRQDSKTLLWSLKQHQNAIKQSFSKLIIQKEEEVHQIIEDTQVAEIEDEEELYDNVTSNNNYLIENDSYKLKFKKINKKTNSNSVSVKTVSFSDYLRTSCYQLDDEYNISNNNNNNRSNQRRSRSVSPYLNNKKPVKSILKKQIVQDELSEDDNEVDDIVDDNNNNNNNNNELITDTFSLNNQAASSSHSSSESLSSGRSVSTNSLLCSDIYGGFNSEYDENNIIINNNTQGDEDEHLGEEEEEEETKQDHSTTNKSNKNKFIDFITKKRQAFLNHDYKQQFYEQDSIKFYPPTTPNNIDSKRHKTKQNRSYSADKSKNHYNNNNQHYNNHQLIQQNKKKPTEPLPVTAAAATNYKQTRLNSSLKKEKLRNYKKIVTQIKKSKPLLGYDWALDTIETKLNTTNTKFDKPETYWQELSQFRNQNKDECISNKQANFDASSLSNTTNFFNEIDATNTDAAAAAAVTDDADGRNHKCIHSYTLNERLFPVPIYKGKNGQSACPVCKSTRKEATTYCPQFLKISIPKSRIIQSYKIQPNKRSESNNNNNNKAPEDTLSLAEVNKNK